jgi:hypothetical protein
MRYPTGTKTASLNQITASALKYVGLINIVRIAHYGEESYFLTNGEGFLLLPHVVRINIR